MSDVPATTVHLVIARCTRDERPCCELCGDPLVGARGKDWALHHRRYRMGRPDDHAVENLLAVHGASNVDACHGRIHGSKVHAMANGWSLSRHGKADPARIAVAYMGAGLVVLDGDGLAWPVGEAA